MVRALVSRTAHPYSPSYRVGTVRWGFGKGHCTGHSGSVQGTVQAVGGSVRAVGGSVRARYGPFGFGTGPGEASNGPRRHRYRPSGVWYSIGTGNWSDRRVYPIKAHDAFTG